MFRSVLANVSGLGLPYFQWQCEAPSHWVNEKFMSAVRPASLYYITILYWFRMLS